jgi:uncharacterized membrane protein (UPF0127 family)
MLSACTGHEPAREARRASPAAPAAVSIPDPPTATLPDGAMIHLELAVTQEEIGQGLMFRASLPENRGMLFLFPEPRLATFWMKDTWVPLDMVFLDGAGTVVNVAADAEPCPSEPCPRYRSEAPVTAVLELLAGSAARHGVESGTTIVFSDVPGYPVEQAG